MAGSPLITGICGRLGGMSGTLASFTLLFGQGLTPLLAMAKEKAPHSSPPGLTSQQSYQDFSVVELFSLADSFCTLVRCLSCMTCSSPRSIHDPDLRLRRRHSTASPLSFVRPSANCSPVVSQRVVQGLLHGHSNDQHVSG